VRPVLLALAALAGGVGGILTVGGADPAAAHTDLLQASPGPSQQAGDPLQFIDLAFLEPVSDAVVRVTFDGAELPGTMLTDEGTIIRFQLEEPLSQPGRYDVSYEMLSFDLDQTESGFFFTFAPDSPPPLRLGNVTEAGSGGRDWIPIIATVVLVGSLAGLAFMFLDRLEGRRQTADVRGDEPNDT
jgi:methionine-rich copper-binding protein CopC